MNEMKLSPGARYVLEKLAAEKGISTPIASALITIASALKSTDYRMMSYEISDVKDYIQ